MQADSAINAASETVNSDLVAQMNAKIVKDKQKYEAKEKKFKGAITQIAAEMQQLEEKNQELQIQTETMQQEFSEKLNQKNQKESLDAEESTEKSETLGAL